MLAIRSLGENRLPANQILAEGGLMRNSHPTEKTVYSIAAGCNGYKYPESDFSIRYGPSFLTWRLTTLRIYPHAEENNSSERAGMITAFRRAKTAKPLNIGNLRPAKWRHSLTPKLVKPPFFSKLTANSRCEGYCNFSECPTRGCCIAFLETITLGVLNYPRNYDSKTFEEMS
jgi:hypothetical protein